MRVAINLLTEDPRHPSGAYWFWAQILPEMANLLAPGEELCLITSPACRAVYDGYGPQVRHIRYPWSNEHRVLRTLSEQLYSPLRLPLSRIDVLNTAIAPPVKPCRSLVVHIKSMHAFTRPNFPKLRGMYRRSAYRHSARMADAIILNSESLRSEVLHHLDVDPAKLRLVPEAVDHDLFRPGEPAQARTRLAAYGLVKPFVLFVSSLWPYKNCEGLLRAWAAVRPELGDRLLAVVGGGKHAAYIAHLKALVVELGIANDVVFVGHVAHEETARFYQAADAFVYPSFNETFGLPILEAMACGCPVVTSNVTAMPETSGGAAILCNPSDHAPIASSLLEALGPRSQQLRDQGLHRAAQFSWAKTAARTLAVYREVTKQDVPRRSARGS